ncbi:MAG: CopG family transcriptional regulator [Rhizobiales bacterium]|nr:CopG family transcriptional regulator [Hyphomicrobiales bacterium]
MNRKRIHVYLGDEAHLVQQAAKKRGVSISRLVQIALIALLNTDKDKRDALLLRRIERIFQLLKKIDRDANISSESLALFIQYELAIKPPIPISDQASAKAQGHERFIQFIKRVAGRIAKGKSLVGEVVEEISVTQDDFYQLDLEENGDENEQK